MVGKDVGLYKNIYTANVYDMNLRWLSWSKIITLILCLHYCWKNSKCIFVHYGWFVFQHPFCPNVVDGVALTGNCQSMQIMMAFHNHLIFFLLLHSVVFGPLESVTLTNDWNPPQLRVHMRCFCKAYIVQWWPGGHGPSLSTLYLLEFSWIKTKYQSAVGLIPELLLLNQQTFCCYHYMG